MPKLPTGWKHVDLVVRPQLDRELHVDYSAARLVLVRRGHRELWYQGRHKGQNWGRVCWEPGFASWVELEPGRHHSALRLFEGRFAQHKVHEVIAGLRALFEEPELEAWMIRKDRTLVIPAGGPERGLYPPMDPAR